MVLPAETEERVKRRALSACQDNLRKVVDVSRKLPQLVDHFASGDKENARRLFSEIKAVRKKYGMRTVYMIDDTFILNRDWLDEFLRCYRQQVNLPLICLVRVDLLTEEIVKDLKAANCYSVFFGIESGNERLRRQILGKHISDEQIINAAGWLKKYGIKFRTYNMLGIPEETLADAWQTVRLNIKIKTDYPWCSLLQPYPRTRIEEYARSKKLLNTDNDSISALFFRGSLINSADKQKLVSLQKLFLLAVKFPFFLPLIKLLIMIPSNPVYDLIFSLGYAFNYRKSENLSWAEVIGMGLRNYWFLLTG